MKVFIALSVLLATACASPVGDYQHYQTTPVPIVKFDHQQNHDGSYQYAYETGNGISAHESGYVKNAGVKDAEIQVAQGYYSYTGPDGHPITVHYTADENGFRAEGDHLPTPPPLPKEIADVWAKIASQPQQQQQQQYYDQNNHQQQYYNKAY
ncbi:CLUMA_CG009417, isoform A [Clunio marinus]|uniref:CLUMA_CG009417, isoform A n=1 Tax=Clunio marinus TaxID=568069 RepID=A0A1J1I6U2_9DIPT|nr:CLUMA_CG009417, isoform A [Clunio marinus]